ncbi:HNRNPR [Cordylochernes scorpioides]|uniref:HNRNPR n=1 Tax=Cordylochernes scorpioides TaxID=51811 RepID=A0ABY6JWY6_9ARAC|nr:HNRNPR [Cordylochernes scorpioides]
MEWNWDFRWVKVLYARNLTSDMNEDKLKEISARWSGVKKIKDYAFIHFEARQSAVKAIEGLDKKDVGGGTVISVSLAKPPSDKKKKEEMLRNRERRMMQSMQSRAVLMGMPSIGRSGGRGSRMDPRSYEYNYDYYGYGDYQGGYADPYFEDFYCNTYEDYYSYGSPPRGATGRGQRGRSLQDRVCLTIEWCL